MTSDLTNNFAYKTRHITETLRQHMELFGYEEVLLPMIEPADIFLTRAGDTIIDRLFTFERGGKQRALRPEFTASAAYRFGQQSTEGPVRWQFNGAIFEDDPSTSGQQHQRYSIGAEFIGQAGIMAEAEIISMAVQGLERLGIRDWHLSIGHVGLQMHLLAQHQLDRRVIRSILAQRELLRLGDEGLALASANLRNSLPQDRESGGVHATGGLEAERMLDVLLNSTGYGKTLGGRTRQDIAERLIDKQMRAQALQNIELALKQFQQWEQLQGDAVQVFSAVRSLITDDDQIAQDLLNEWQQLLTLLGQYGLETDRLQLQADLTRHWEYYTGIVFGVWNDAGLLLAAGGRYDDLAHLLGNDQPVPAVGFAYYADAIIRSLDSVPPYPSALTFNPGTLSDAATVSTVRFLREAGISVALSQSTAADLTGGEEGIDYRARTYALNEIDELVQDLKAAQA